METKDFVAYVGNADFHDARVQTVCYEGEQAEVTLKSISGRELKVSFTGVKRFAANQPVGMMIYALNEMRADAPYRRFVFTNWDEEDPACLEVEARELSVNEKENAK